MEKDLNINGYKEYDQLSESERRMVDNRASNMLASGAMLSDNEFSELIRKGIVNPEHLSKLNEAIDRKEMDRNEQANKMREQLFIDRVRNGFYGNQQPPVNVNINNDSSDVRDLKNEVSSLKEEISQLKELLKQNFK